MSSPLQSALRRSVEIGPSDDQLDRLRNLYAEGKRDLNKANADLASAELDFEVAQSRPGGLPAASARRERDTAVLEAQIALTQAYSKICAYRRGSALAPTRFRGRRSAPSSDCGGMALLAPRLEKSDSAARRGVRD